MGAGGKVFITLLVKLGVVASIAAFVIRYQPLRRTLMLESRPLDQRLRLSFWFSAIFGSGVAIRVLVRSYEAVDLGLEGSMLAGVVGGLRYRDDYRHPDLCTCDAEA